MPEHLDATSAPPPAAGRARPRLVVLAVVGAFVLPIVLAWAAAFGIIPGWVSGQVNRGLLLVASEPLQLESIPADTLRHDYGQWSVIVLAAPDCTAPCVFTDDMLARFAQAIATEGERVFIYRADAGNQVPPGVRALPLGAADRTLLETLGGDAPAEALILDYEGRPVLAYPGPSVPADVLKDLRRLLRASRTP
jgi:hypothetical protein